MNTTQGNQPPAEHILYHVYYYCMLSSDEPEQNNQLLKQIKDVTESYLFDLTRQKKNAERAKSKKC